MNQPAQNRHGRRRLLHRILPLMAAGVLLAGCSGTGYGSAPSSPPAEAGMVISTSAGTLGTYVTDAQGRALYLWMADTAGTPTCFSSCASSWPPMLAGETPQASGSVMASKVGTVSRSGGGQQVTYNGHPLYYFAGDTQSGQIAGQGSNGFGAKWWLVDPSGQAITAGADTPQATPSSRVGY